MNAAIDIPREAIRAFCQRWQIRELSIFGSALRDDFGPSSDVDVLISFAPGGAMTLESCIAMQDELSLIFGGRSVDLIEQRFINNPFRRHSILATREVVYAD